MATDVGSHDVTFDGVFDVEGVRVNYDVRHELLWTIIAVLDLLERKLWPCKTNCKCSYIRKYTVFH